MSHQQSDEHGAVVEDALQDGRRPAPAGTRHEMAPIDDPAEADDIESIPLPEPPKDDR